MPVEEEGSTYLADVDADSDDARTLRPLQAAACTYRIAFSPRAGQKMFTVQGTMSVAAGSMKEVIEKSTQHLSTGDLRDRLYLKDVPGDVPIGAQKEARASTPARDIRSRGQALYLDI